MKSGADAGIAGVEEPRPGASRLSWNRLALDITAAPALVTILTIVLIVRDQGGYFSTSFGWSAMCLLAVIATWIVATGRTDAGPLDLIFLAALLAVSAWAGLSIIWSVDPSQSVLELERWLVLVAGCGAFLVLARAGQVRLLTASIVFAIAAICIYSLATRLLPSAGHFHPSDPTAGYRLFEPVGYWNALGIFAVLGIVLAIGLATDTKGTLLGRSLGAISLTFLPLTLYFTFSRGAWLALGGGLLLTVALSGDRARLIAEGAAFAIAPAIAILLAAQSRGLTDENALLATASRQGHRLGTVLIVLVLVSVGLTWLVSQVESRISLGRRSRRVFDLALVLIAAVAVAIVLIGKGGPVAVAKKSYDSFSMTTPPRSQTNLNQRLFTLNGNGRFLLWSVALDSLHGHWLGGTGAGSFGRNWDRSPRADEVVLDAHGLYVETLSELGFLGLLLLVFALAIPITAAIRARKVPLVPAIAGAYGAFLLHNAIDWDWELSGVALTGLLIGCLALVAARRPVEAQLKARTRVLIGGAAAVATAFAGVALIGNGALARANTANQDHRYASAAASAALARRWMPWSDEPLKALGEAQLEQGNSSAAYASFHKAISIDARDWQAWLDLAASATGSDRTRAVHQAHQLYPTSPEIVEFKNSVGAR